MNWFLRAAYYVPGREEPFAVVVCGDRNAPEALGIPWPLKN